jgi:hypothetical protein
MIKAFIVVPKDGINMDSITINARNISYESPLQNVITMIGNRRGGAATYNYGIIFTDRCYSQWMEALEVNADVRTVFPPKSFHIFTIIEQS